MSQRNGDRSRFNRNRKAKIARRTRWSAAVKKTGAKTATPAAKSPSARRAVASQSLLDQ